MGCTSILTRIGYLIGREDAIRHDSLVDRLIARQRAVADESDKHFHRDLFLQTENQNSTFLSRRRDCVSEVLEADH